MAAELSLVTSMGSLSWWRRSAEGRGLLIPAATAALALRIFSGGRLCRRFQRNEPCPACPESRGHLTMSSVAREAMRRARH